VSAGNKATCAVMHSGSVKCWGQNYYGPANNYSQQNAQIPTDVPGLSSNIAEVSVGPSNHTCARTTSGSVFCLGGNANGQLGDGTANDSLVPNCVASIGGTECASAKPPPFEDDKQLWGCGISHTKTSAGLAILLGLLGWTAWQRRRWVAQ